MARYTYPQNLISEILTENTFKEFVKNIPRDINETMDFLLKEVDFTTEKKGQIIIVYRYKHYLTLDQTGVRVNVTRERVRQIQDKMLELLRKPKCVEYILHGLSKMKKDKKEHL